MTDAQLGLLITAIATFGAGVVGSLKWAVGRITKAIDDNTTARDAQTAAMLEHAKAMTALTVKIDAVADFVQEHTPPIGTIVPRHGRTQSQPRGVPIVERRRTQADEDR